MRLIGSAMVGILLAGSGPVMAQAAGAPDQRAATAVKSGVDAWQQGDYAKAVAIWRPLALAGDADAQFNMGQASKLGRGAAVDLPVALEWYRKAAAQGHGRAEENYGLLLFNQNRRQEAMPYISRAADRGEPRAQYLLATALYNGDLAPRDWVRAYALMTRASGAGLPQAANGLATMDQYIPEDQRKKGLALAADMAKAQSAPALASVSPPATPPATPPPSPTAPAPPPATPKVAVAPPPVAPSPRAAPVPAALPPPRPAPTPAPAPVVAAKPPAPAGSGDWRVQLGAFSSDDRAKALWASMTGKVTGLGQYQPYLVKGGNVTRLQAGPLATEAEAARLCGTVRATGADCLVKRR